MTIPPFLKIGDNVAIIAPSGFLVKEQITNAIEMLSNWNLKVHIGKNIFSKFYTFAGNDEQRLFDFQNAIDDNSIKAIFCARGGYGTLRILDKINWTKFIEKPKNFISVFKKWSTAVFRFKKVISATLLSSDLLTIIFFLPVKPMPLSSFNTA